MQASVQFDPFVRLDAIQAPATCIQFACKSFHSDRVACERASERASPMRSSHQSHSLLEQSCTRSGAAAKLSSTQIPLARLSSAQLAARKCSFRLHCSMRSNARTSNSALSLSFCRSSPLGSSAGSELSPARLHAADDCAHAVRTA